MDCQRCHREAAAWLDTYQDLALCDGCADRSDAYGMAFVTVLTRADAQRKSESEATRGGHDEAA